MLLALLPLGPKPRPREAIWLTAWLCCLKLARATVSAARCHLACGELIWGVRWPIRRVRFSIALRDGSGSKPVAVFRFLSEDWSPWVALLRMRECWPELRFEMKAGYLEIDKEAG